MRLHDWLIALTLTALTLLAAIQVGPDVVQTLSQAGPDRVYHDTYYVIARNNYVAIALLIVTVTTALHYALIRRASPRLAASGAIAICTLAIGTIIAAAPQIVLGRVGRPRRYLDYPEAFERWQLLSALGSTLAVSALITLAVLGVRALLLRRRAR